MAKKKTRGQTGGDVVILVEGIRHHTDNKVSHTFEAPWKPVVGGKKGKLTTVGNATNFATMFTSAGLELPDDEKIRYFRVTVEEVRAKDYRVQYGRKKSHSKRQ